ncbi:uncharacterized protein [Nothobranchius furzeri]|uniref:uncharacterized protein isoform X2 n=1 Tax=Nothobranchius furzeri TaxID=105023 RepID=UPI0039049F2D
MLANKNSHFILSGKMRVLSDQQLWNQERTSSLDQEQPEPLQEGPEPPQIQVEQEELEPLQILGQEELCISQDEERFVKKEETVPFLNEPKPNSHQLLSSVFSEAEIRAAAPAVSTGDGTSKASCLGKR